MAEGELLIGTDRYRVDGDGQVSLWARDAWTYDLVGTAEAAAVIYALELDRERRAIYAALCHEGSDVVQRVTTRVLSLRDGTKPIPDAVQEAAALRERVRGLAARVRELSSIIRFD